MNILLSILSVLKTIQNLLRRKPDQKLMVIYWGLTTVISAICAGVSHLDETDATLVTPWAFLAFPFALSMVIFSIKWVWKHILHR